MAEIDTVCTMLI